MEQSIRRSALWLYLGQLVNTVVGFVAGILLARLLGPAELGLFVAVTAFTSSVLVVVQFGLPQALLQGREIDDDRCDGAFWWMTLLALLAVAGLVAIAPALGRWYDSAGFVPVLELMCATFLLLPYNAVGLALLRRALRFDQVVRIELAAAGLALSVSLPLAFAGAGVVSLVAGAWAAMGAVSVLLWRQVPWRPGRVRLRPVFGLLRYAWFAMWNGLIGSAGSRVDNMLVGALLGTLPLGLYNRAYSLARIPTDQFAESLNPLLLRSIAAVQDDRAQAAALLDTAMTAIAIVTLPLLAVLFVAGPLAIEVLYGPQWVAAGGPLRAMVIGAVCLVLAVPLRGYINAVGLVRQLLWVNLAGLIMTVALIVLLWPWGLLGIALGISLRELALLGLLVGLLRRARAGIMVGALARSIAPAGLAAIVGGLAGATVSAWWAAAAPLPKLVLVTLAILGVSTLTLGLLLALWRDHPGLAWTRGLLLPTLARLMQRR